MDNNSLDIDELSNILDISTEKLDEILTEKCKYISTEIIAKIKILSKNLYALPYFNSDCNIVKEYIDSNRILDTTEKKLNIIMDLLGFDNIDDMVDAAKTIHQQNTTEQENNNKCKCHDKDDDDSRKGCCCHDEGVECLKSEEINSDGIKGCVKAFKIDPSKITPDAIERFLNNIFE